jgi:cytoskeletal protein CcmA (bactofilin family)
LLATARHARFNRQLPDQLTIDAEISMFRRKDTDPPRPGGAAPKAPEPTFARPAAEPAPTVEPKAPGASSWAPALAGTSESRPAPPAPAASMEKRLIVGQGISLSGEITACDRLVVEGDVQVTLNQTKAIEISETGKFTNGKAEVDEAEISGVYEGELTVRGRLLIRSTGRVNGNVRFGEIEVERGGHITGSVSMLPAKGAAPAAGRPEPSAAAGAH